MSVKKHPVVVARFEVVSNLVDAGEYYHHTVTVDRSGRVRSVVVCTDQEVDATPWSGANDPAADDLAEAIVEACRDDHHESRLRLLSLVVHGLLPLGDNLRKVEIPDAVLDGRLGFGPRTSYRADIRKDVRAALRKHPALDWSKRIQTAGTEEREEFVAQITDALKLDPEWLVETLRTSRDGSGVLFDDVVAEHAPSASKDRLAVEHPDSDLPSVIYWDINYGHDFSLVPGGWEEKNVAPILTLTKADTWGEARALPLPGYLNRILEETDDRGHIPDNCEPFHGIRGYDPSSLLDCAVVPWDLESLKEWFPEWDMDVIYEHCTAEGASPGGHIDDYAPGDVELLLAALRVRGYRVERRRFLSALESALHALCTMSPVESHQEDCLCARLDADGEDEEWECCWGEEQRYFADSWNGSWFATVRYGLADDGRLLLRLTAPDDFFEERELPATSTGEFATTEAEALLEDFARGLDSSITLGDSD